MSGSSSKQSPASGSAHGTNPVISCGVPEQAWATALTEGETPGKNAMKYDFGTRCTVTRTPVCTSSLAL